MQRINECSDMHRVYSVYMAWHIACNRCNPSSNNKQHTHTHHHSQCVSGYRIVCIWTNSRRMHTDGRIGSAAVPLLTRVFFKQTTQLRFAYRDVRLESQPAQPFDDASRTECEIIMTVRFSAVQSRQTPLSSHSTQNIKLLLRPVPPSSPHYTSSSLLRRIVPQRSWHNTETMDAYLCAESITEITPKMRVCVCVCVTHVRVLDDKRTHNCAMTKRFLCAHVCTSHAHNRLDFSSGSPFGF